MDVLFKVVDPIAKTDKFSRLIQTMDKEDWAIDRKDRYVMVISSVRYAISKKKTYLYLSIKGPYLF